MTSTTDRTKGWKSQRTGPPKTRAYTPREVEAKWKSFKIGGGVTYRAVLGMAKDAGADLREMRRRLEPQAQTAERTFSGAATAEKVQETVSTPPEELFQTWKVIDPFELPARDFVYGGHYIRKFASLTVAPGGLASHLLSWPSASPSHPEGRYLAPCQCGGKRSFITTPKTHTMKSSGAFWPFSTATTSRKTKLSVGSFWRLDVTAS